MQPPEVPERDADFWQTLCAQMSAGGGVSRRDFNQLLGASMALAGVGCSVGPTPGDILPYATGDATVRVGVPTVYATTLLSHGYGVGVLVGTREGRAIKVEGNPRHPASLGGANAQLQARVLDLYDPDRLRSVLGPAGRSSWDAWVEEARHKLGSDGAGCAVLLAPWQSPSLARQLNNLLERFPALQLYTHTPSPDNAAHGTGNALGEALEPTIDLRGARTVVSLDADIFLTHPGALRHARTWADATPAGPTPQLFCIESALSLTGAKATARLAIRPELLVNVALHLLNACEPQAAAISMPNLGEREVAFVKRVASALKRDVGASVVVAGRHATPTVHACVAALNAAQGAQGRHVHYRKPLLGALERAGNFGVLMARAKAGQVRSLIVLGGNPVHDVPSTGGFAASFASIEHRTYAGTHANETAALCSWKLPVSHTLESWGDAMSEDGALSLMQPVMQPLYDTMSIIDILGALIEPAAPKERAALAAHWQGVGIDAETFARALAQGTPLGAQPTVGAPEVRWPTLLELLRGSDTDPDTCTLHCRMDNTVQESGDCNNAWLQELPDPVSKQAWGNAAWLSPATAAAAGVSTGDWLHIDVSLKPHFLPPNPSYARAAIDLPVIVVPGQADGVVSVTTGYGHTAAGMSVCRDVGADVGALASQVGYFCDARLSRLDRRSAKLAFTQIPASWHGRSDGAQALSDDTTPPASMRGDARPARFAVDGPQWGMAINLDRCTGCQACVVACQAENNIPVVGAVNVRKGRVMHWLRIDRYFADADGGAVANQHAQRTTVQLQPMLCQHCEHAPCEYVCPVGATQHSPDGLNEMVYNRCVGTRYCSNNCPYKVRRFNWFSFHNEHDPIVRMVHNPEVTVRARGVMEKCTFCVQRIRSGVRSAKLAQRPLARDAIVTACQQTCPSQAIAFGDLNRTDSAVRHAFADERATIALPELGTRPRVRYLKSPG